MLTSPPRILSPAPGFPCLLDSAACRIPLFLASDDDDASLRAWCAGLRLRTVGGTTTAAVALAGLTRPVAAEIPAHLRPALGLLPPHTTLVRVELVPAFPPSPASHRARFRLWDLLHDERLVRSRCVAERRRHDDRLSLAFASDLHVAAIWDSIDAAIARHAAELLDDFLHPGRLLRCFVDRANALAAAGDLDVIVLGGDLVDHVRPGPHANPGGSNVDHFIALLADLQVPTFAIPGNHDFRLHPWRPRIYPYASVGLPPRRVAPALRRAGLWDGLPWRLSDLRALHTTDEHGRPALAGHLLGLAPSGDYDIDLGEMRLVFLDTGRDVLPRWRTVEPGRRRVFLRSLPGSWEHPDSEGLNARQIARVAARGGRGAAVFLHAPLFNPPPGVRIESRLPTLAAAADDSTAAAGRFERHLARSGLRQGVFFRNPGAFLRALASAGGDVAVFSGHVHQPHAAVLEPTSLAIRSVAFPHASAAGGGIVFANAPALGQTAMNDGPRPGFLLARFAAGRLGALEHRTLP